MKILFFGAGKSAYNLWQQIEEKPWFCTDDYLAFADNNSDLWGTNFCGKQVISPADIRTYEADLIVITSIYENQIREQLKKELGVCEKQIYSFADYAIKCFLHWTYKKRYNGLGVCKKQEVFDINKIVIYTAITGDYDELKEPLYLADDLTYVCITNNPKIKSKNWNVEYIKGDFRDNVHLARHIKMNPHKYFRDYEVSVWVDGKFQILDDLRKYILQYERQSGILCFPHPVRQCIYDEGAACIMVGKGKKEDIIIQISDYLKNGYPSEQGLYDTGCMVRLHNDEEIKTLMREWEEELMRYSIRDQLSFPYVCWKNGIYPDISDLDINQNAWLKAFDHR